MDLLNLDVAACWSAFIRWNRLFTKRLCSICEQVAIMPVRSDDVLVSELAACIDLEKTTIGFVQSDNSVMICTQVKLVEWKQKTMNNSLVPTYGIGSCEVEKKPLAVMGAAGHRGHRIGCPEEDTDTKHVRNG
jgi:hypothetical protein